MYYNPKMYRYPYYANIPMYKLGSQCGCRTLPVEVGYSRSSNHDVPYLKDYGAEPFVVDINQAAKQNNTFRTALWTGDHLQVTLMSLNVGEDIGLEMHPDVDQFLRIEQGQGLVQMGKSRNHLNFERDVYDDSAILLPAGTWHNLTNTGNVPLKLYSIYSPPNHPFGTVHATQADALASEENNGPVNPNPFITGRTPYEWLQYTESW